MVRQMTEAHRLANQKARAENRAVGDYLKALDENPPRRGRQRTPESMKKRLEEIAATYDSVTPLKRVQLVQERMNLEEALDKMAEPVDIAQLEEGFVEAVSAYSARKGISYAAWREVGVPVPVLRRGGVTRAGNA